MTDYNNSKIYCIKSNETDDVYIGSTCGLLKRRFYEHKKTYKNKNSKNITSKLIMKYSDAYIELVENYPCKTKQELLRREGEIMRITPNCVNVRIEGRTQKEYYVDNKEKIKIKDKIKYEKNKDNILEKSKKYYVDNKSELAIKSKEYRNLNKEKLAIKRKEYRELNKEKIKVKKNIKVPCPICLKLISNSNLKRHIKTQHKPTEI